MTDDRPKKDIKLDWEQHYRSTPMKELHWYSEAIDPEVILAIEKFCPKSGDVLDLGAGPGTVAIELTKLGYNVTATDISPSAVDMAKKRAGRLADKIKFTVDDIRDTKLRKKYDIIHDRGCLHVFNKFDIKKYVENVSRLLKEKGMLLLKTFSTKEPRDDGPNKYSHESINGIFLGYFELLHCEETIYPSTLPVDPKALFCVLRFKCENKGTVAK
jgi:SAM-dependent methyltransferase